MAEDQFHKFMARMDEIWAHKEAVSSTVLASFQKEYIDEMEKFRKEMNTKITMFEKNFTSALKDVSTEIHNNMQLKHQELEFENRDHDRRLSLVEKIVLGVAAAFGMAIVGALTTLVLK